MNTAQQNIGEKIRILRLQKGMSQEQLALHAGINTSYLGQVERGEKNPTIKTLEKITNGLDSSLENLFKTTGHIASDKNAVLTLLTSDDLKQFIVETIKSSEFDSHLNPHKCKDKK